MDKKILAILIAIAVIIGGIFLVRYYRNQPIIPDEDQAQVQNTNGNTSAVEELKKVNDIRNNPEVIKDREDACRKLPKDKVELCLEGIKN